MTTASSFPPPLVLPLHSSNPFEKLPKSTSTSSFAQAFAAWQSVLDAYRSAWDALVDVDDHHTAFLAMHVVRNTVEEYKNHLLTRPPKEGDLANLDNLRIHLDAVYALHDTFMDEGHIDYPSLRRETLGELQQLQEDATRRCAQHAMTLACEAFPPLSYSSSIDDLHAIEHAVQLIETYHRISSSVIHDFDITPLARSMQSIAEQESKGFPDYKDEAFAALFEDLTVRIGKLHLLRTRKKSSV